MEAVKRKRGRPKGSKNKSKLVSPASEILNPIIKIKKCEECTEYLLCKDVKASQNNKLSCEKFQDNFPEIEEYEEVEEKVCIICHRLFQGEEEDVACGICESNDGTKSTEDIKKPEVKVYTADKVSEEDEDYPYIPHKCQGACEKCGSCPHAFPHDPYEEDVFDGECVDMGLCEAIGYNVICRPL